jgi:hypothetical protein
MTVIAWLTLIINSWLNLFLLKDYVDVRLNEIAYNNTTVKPWNFH